MDSEESGEEFEGVDNVIESNGESNGEQDRLAQPVDTEEPPRLSFPVIGMGGSAGGLEAFTEFFKSMPPDSGMAFVLIQHLPPERKSLMAEILSKRTAMPVREVVDGIAIEPNHVYVIRPGRTLTIKHGTLHLGEPLEKRGHRRPVDDFFRSLAEEQRERAICIIMSGMGSNGTAGAQVVKAVGGVCIAQDPDTAKFPSMPRALMDSGLSDFVLRPEEIPDFLRRYSQQPYVRTRPTPTAIQRRDVLQLQEVFAILRTRTRHAFDGYKKPTVLRRIQRRMSLSQIANLPDYVKLLRQNPNEIASLADDLLIHVTGFFRDPDAWQSLHDRVIVPLVAERESEAPIRAWVTACSSGEEAYTLAMLLVEAMEAASKHFDVKIFATDTADRTLSQARAGSYPNGIEGEITPARLDRFFDKDDSTYRVKNEVRELVVFAPQNVLQDPPFSRLDICTCRNLLIYLEPEVQKRILTLLHFGIREGGFLFLGNAETAGDFDGMFETLDKKWRIYRRIGQSRHGSANFPHPVLTSLADEHGDAIARQAPRQSMTQIAQRALLNRFTPPSVVIDRQHRIAFFHGDTEPFLTQPPGEPTRDILQLCREPVRNAVRTVIHQGMTQNVPTIIRDGYIETEAGPMRVEVSIAPLDQRHAQGYYLLSFLLIRRPEALPIAAEQTSTEDPRHLEEELHRVRDELQNTIEELQTSNEELKASNEEATSINEELQSTNEELETSKEELQSLNEELTTVNTQLQAKMEELEATSSDLDSLLSSTDIAVIFLDMHFRIRRFTPAMRDLLELIPSDVGRPVANLARKFNDPDWLVDAKSVLEKLTPMEKEIRSHSGRCYMRRVLPHRTADNRIGGVVMTFIDITDRKVAEQKADLAHYRAQVVLDQMSAAIVLADASGHITFANKGVERIFGFSAKYVAGTADYRHWPFMHLDGVPYGEHEMPLARAIERQEDIAGELMRFRRPDGREIDLSSNAAAIKDKQGNVTAALMVCTDVSQQHYAEQALHESEQRYRLVVEALDEGVLWVDADGVVLAANPAAGRILGLAPDQLIGADPVHWSHRLVRSDRSPLPIDDMPVMQGLKSGESCHEVLVGVLSDQAELQWLSFDCAPLFRDDERRPYAAVCSFSDITGRKRTEETLRDAKATAESASQAKDQFLATVSHELRTPLSAIGLWARVLAGKTDQDDNYKEAIEGILHGVQSQKKLIEDLIDSSRVAMGKLRLDLRRVDLAPVISDAITAIRGAAENKGIELHEEIDPNLGIVVADADRLEQVIWNLLSNAVKFTASDERIDVSVRRRDGHIEIRVADTGQGISSDVLPHVFVPFRQGIATGGHRASGGLGLGLSITKEIVELHGGTINVTSAGLGKGTVATVRLPLQKVGTRPSERATAAKAGVKDASATLQLGNMLILLVEDDHANRHAVGALLRNAGASVVAVDSGAAALDAFRERRPDMIVADINMPEMDGHQLMQAIRAAESDSGAPRVPAIALTALSSVNDQTRAIESGFDRHVAKPPNPAVLFDMIAQLVHGHR